MENRNYIAINMNKRAEHRENKRMWKNIKRKISDVVSSIITFIAIGSTILFVLVVDSLPLKETYLYGSICMIVCICALIVSYRKGTLK